MRRDLGAGNTANLSKRLSGDEAFERYRELTAATVTAATVENYHYGWVKFWSWMDKTSPSLKYLDQVSAEHLSWFRDWMISEEGGFKKRTANDYLRNIGTVIAKLIKVRAYPGPNVVLQVDRFSKRELRIERGQPEFLSLEEIPRLLHSARDTDVDLFAFTALCVYAGLRHREAIMARWDWITWPKPGQSSHEGFITIPEKDGLTGFETKSGRTRAVPLNNSFVRAILPLRGPRPAPGYIVASHVTELGKKKYRWDVRKRFNKARNAAGIKKSIQPKSLRHTFASQCVIKGIDPYKLMIWMGHEDLTTLGIYAHLNPSDPAMAQLSAALDFGESQAARSRREKIKVV